jgi:hypothetical protein
MRHDAAAINAYDITRYPDYRGDAPPDAPRHHHRVPRDEHYRFTPENLLIVEPGTAVVNASARETIKRLEAQKVEVIPFDCHGIMQGGVNGMRCITLEMRRDEGPYLEG